MTDQNNHTAALTLGTELLGLTKRSDETKEMLRIRDKVGHFPQELVVDKIKIYNEMMKYAKENLRTEDFAKFYSAF